MLLMGFKGHIRSWKLFGTLFFYPGKKMRNTELECSHFVHDVYRIAMCVWVKEKKKAPKAKYLNRQKSPKSRSNLPA